MSKYVFLLAELAAGEKITMISALINTLNTARWACYNDAAANKIKGINTNAKS